MSIILAVLFQATRLTVGLQKLPHQHGDADGWTRVTRDIAET
jgi:hypothetical protein